MKRSAQAPGLLEGLTLETSLDSSGRLPKRKKGKALCLSRASHELRTPLTTIIGAAAILKETALDADQRTLLTMIDQGAATLQHLIEVLLLRAQLRSGTVQMNIHAEDLAQTLSRVVADLSGEARDRSMTLTFEPVDLPSSALIDGLRLSQLTAGVICRAMNRFNSGTICLTARWRSDRLTCEVAAQATVCPKIGRAARHHEGPNALDEAALNQACCASLAMAMGGSMYDVGRTGPGRGGLAFSVPATIPKVQLRRPPIGHVIRRLKVLIAEDNPSIQILMSRIVSAADCDPVVVSDGLEAVAAASIEHFDLCFMDLRMPNLDGEAALDRLRKLPNTEDLSVVAVTAEISPTARNAGFDGFLGKPLQPALILQAIEDRRRAAA